MVWLIDVVPLESPAGQVECTTVPGSATMRTTRSTAPGFRPMA